MEWSNSYIGTISDLSSWYTCLKRTLLLTISFIYHIILFWRQKPPTPESMLFIAEERQGVSNATLVWEEGVGIHRGRGQMSTICKKGAILWKCLNTFVPFLSLFWGSWREKCGIFSNRWTSTEMVKQYSFPADESFVLKVLRSCCKTWKIQYFSPDWAWIC